jgi:hypothetical protein
MARYTEKVERKSSAIAGEKRKNEEEHQIIVENSYQYFT